MSKTISVSDEVWKQLKDGGRKGESFNTIIERMIYTVDEQYKIMSKLRGQLEGQDE